MAFVEEEVLDIVRACVNVPDWVDAGRETKRELFALVNGYNFNNELITRIEHIEDSKKAKAREKYSRNIVDLFERILAPTSHIYSATGTHKRYNLNTDEKNKELVSIVNDVSGGKSLEQWLKCFWMPLYHSDPNGVIFLEYLADSETPPYPTYKSIDDIRKYHCDGQSLKWILFEPVDLGKGKQKWRFVDDEKDWCIIQDGQSYSILEDLTFEHPFGVTPGLIISDVEKLGQKDRNSPAWKVTDLTKEYARDQSIKTIYKFLQGFPTFWRYVQTCMTCNGTGKTGEDKCSDCDGHGFYLNKDVTDLVTLPIPRGDEPKLAPDIAGAITPPLDIWTQYTDELDLLEDTAFITLWGSIMRGESKETATKTFIDKQPVISRLNEYADVAEFMERKLTEMVANYVDPLKPKEESVATVIYGRGYIIEPLDVLRARYEQSKEKGDNNVILDQQFREYITAKYKTDPETLRRQELKSMVEPYIHLSIDKVKEIYGDVEAQKKGLFTDWWQTLANEDLVKESEKLKVDYEEWFNNKNVDPNGNNGTGAPLE